MVSTNALSVTHQWLPSTHESLAFVCLPEIKSSLFQNNLVKLTLLFICLTGKSLTNTATGTKGRITDRHSKPLFVKPASDLHQEVNNNLDKLQLKVSVSLIRWEPGLSGWHNAVTETELFMHRHLPLFFLKKSMRSTAVLNCLENMARRTQPDFIHLLQHCASPADPEMKHDTEPVTV